MFSSPRRESEFHLRRFLPPRRISRKTAVSLSLHRVEQRFQSSEVVVAAHGVVVGAGGGVGNGDGNAPGRDAFALNHEVGGE